MTNEEVLQAALFIGDRMRDAILGLGCSATPPFSNDEMGEAGKEAWEWEQFIARLGLAGSGETDA